MKLITLTFILFTSISFNVHGQGSIGYQTPKDGIKDLVDIDLAPRVLKDDNNTFMILLYRSAYKSIEELSENELRLGGLRVNPSTYIGSRTTYYNNVKIVFLNDKKNNIQIKGLPDKSKLSNFVFSPDQSMVAMTNTTPEGVELWVLDVSSTEAKKINDLKINSVLRNSINWFKSGDRLLVKVRVNSLKGIINSKKQVPTGPVITENNGAKAQNRTYQDLLKNPIDEYNFEQLSTSELYEVLLNGDSEIWATSALFERIVFSPDGNYVMIRKIKRPFSYIVPYFRFPIETTVYDTSGKLIKLIADDPLLEELPKGFMATKTTPRSFSWRSDQSATLTYIEALDRGNPENNVKFRDALYQWKAPFSENPELVVKTINRFRSVYWGNKTTAIIIDRWWNSRNTKTYLFNPSNPKQELKKINDRNYQDIYSDEGGFVMIKNDLGRNVLNIKNNNLFLIGDGFSDKGQYPFVDKIDVETLKKKRLYESTYETKFENILNFDTKTEELFVRIESKDEYPNYYFKEIGNKKIRQLTFFKNPFESLKKIQSELITYFRDDGLELSGTLYLPEGFDKLKPKRKPMILWAYPREFKDSNSASQKTSNPNRFIYPSWGSPIYWVTQGYVVLDRAAFPIIGSGDKQPNDSFREQLVSNGKAAIDALNNLKYIDPDKVAVGGHSYGAFMVANLLSHSNLFAAGIARSGAYNRTLTPFGFQSEERSYWDAPELYNYMSPFMHADKMKTPLLLIHGEADNNSGTYPMQSIRYFNALKGLGATTRLVIFPKESHGYRAKETILHLLWEQDQWLEKYVKNPNKQLIEIKKDRHYKKG